MFGLPVRRSPLIYYLSHKHWRGCSQTAERPWARLLAVRISMTTAMLKDDGIRYSALPLYGTIGATWLLRPDGSLWRANSDLGLELEPLPATMLGVALAAGAMRLHVRRLGRGDAGWRRLRSRPARYGGGGDDGDERRGRQDAGQFRVGGCLHRCGSRPRRERSRNRAGSRRPRARAERDGIASKEDGHLELDASFIVASKVVRHVPVDFFRKGFLDRVAAVGRQSRGAVDKIKGSGRKFDDVRKRLRQ